MNSWLLLLRWRFRQSGLGSAGAAGVVLILALIPFWWSVVVPHQEKIGELKSRISLDESAGNLVASKNPSEEKLERFYRSFPQEAAVPDLLMKLYEAASKNHLELDKGEYALVSPDGERLKRYKMTLPVRGNFRNILAFSRDAVEHIPSLALEGINLRRDKSDDSEVEARFSFTIYLNDVK